MPADGPSSPAANVTRYATYNGGVTWSRDGKQARLPQPAPRPADRPRPDLQKPAAGGSAGRRQRRRSTGTTSTCGSSAVDAHAGRRRRPSRPTAAGRLPRRPTATTCGSPAPTAVSVTRLTTGGTQPAARSSGRRRRSRHCVYFLDGTGDLRHARTARRRSADGRRQPRPDAVSFTGQDDRQAGRGVRARCSTRAGGACRDNFYDAKLHGADWNDGPREVPAAGQARRHEGRPVRAASA